jgi:hypothetical protein
MYDGMSRWMRRFKGEVLGIQYDAGLRVVPIVKADGEPVEAAAARDFESEACAELSQNHRPAVKKEP